MRNISTIDINKISFSYDKRQIFSEFSLKISKGHIVVLSGHNGSGKTCLCRLIMGLLEPSVGEISILGQQNLPLHSRGELIGYVKQNPKRQLFGISVYEELTWMSKLMDKQIDDTKLEMLLQHLNLWHLREAFVHQLSGGEAQKLVLASVLTRDIDFLVLDEPSTALDLESKKNVAKMINQAAEDGIGSLIVTHDYAFMDYLNMSQQKVIGG